MAPRRMFARVRAASPGRRALTLVAALGAIAATGQAPLGFWWATLAALAILTERIARAGAGTGLWLGWMAGTGYFAAALFWIIEPFLIDVARYGWMAPFALVFMATGMALFWLLASAIAALAGPHRGARAFGFAFGLVLADLLRGYVLTGFPWASVGHVWIGTPVMQAAALGGTPLLGLIAVLPPALAALPGAPRRRAALAGAAVMLLGTAWLAGAEREASLATDPAPAAPLVRLIQPNAPQDQKWDGQMWRVFLDRMMALSAAPSDRAPDLVVWPETAVPFLMDNAGAMFAEIAGMSGAGRVAVGIQREDGLRFYNSLAFADGAGEVTDVYDKWHLVPFGEYVPMGDLAADIGIRAFASREGYGYSAGPGARVIDLGPLGRVLPLICYEAVFPQDLRAAPERADWILQVTNDAWFGNVAGPYQHLAQARLRAVEQGLPLLRSANTGVTAVIDAGGRIVDSLPLNTNGHLDARLPISLSPTPYARMGDLPATILAAAVLLVLALRRRSLSG